MDHQGHHSRHEPESSQPLVPADIVINARDQELIDTARPLVKKIILGREECTAGTVASALRSVTGRIYTGVCIQLNCGIGFCAEHAAVAEMIKGGETEIESVVAVSLHRVLPPCGRCREFLIQINPRNAETRVILRAGHTVSLKELLPLHWFFGNYEG
ncbi:MAG: cytidine deaminase [Candidatus Methylacidiphilales bacterium]|nr:cytidine deaminase [Candidatus Methylacidiphilales bacterium]